MIIDNYVKIITCICLGAALLQKGPFFFSTLQLWKSLPPSPLNSLNHRRVLHPGDGQSTTRCNTWRSKLRRFNQWFGLVVGPVVSMRYPEWESQNGNPGLPRNPKPDIELAIAWSFMQENKGWNIMAAVFAASLGCQVAASIYCNWVCPRLGVSNFW